MQIFNNLIFQQLSKINICYYKDSRYFDADVIQRKNQTATQYNLYINTLNNDTLDSVIEKTNNYFFVDDISLKKYIYLPVVKMLFYFALKAINNNSATIKIYNSEIYKIFNIEYRTLREYYSRLSLILPGLKYRYFDNLTPKENTFCNIDLSNKSDYIVVCFNQTIFNKHIKASQMPISFDTLIFDNYIFNSKYDCRAFYIYLAYIFNKQIDFNLLVNSCYEYLDKTEKAIQTAQHLKQQIYNPVCKAINKLLFYKLLKIKQNSNSIYDFIFDNGYINVDNLYFTDRQIKQYEIATKRRVIKDKKLSEWKEFNKLKSLDFMRDYKQFFNILYI